VHPKDAADWTWLRPDIPQRVAALAERYALVIVTNQSGQGFRVPRVAAVLRALRSTLAAGSGERGEMMACVATGQDQWRKPHSTIYERYIAPIVPATQRELIIIGDAAGREGDFSDSDRSFAYNVSLVVRHGGTGAPTVKFSTPEEFFWEEPGRERTWRHPDPRQWLTATGAVDVQLPARVRAVLLVGSAGSGKSRLAGELAALGWEVVSRDAIGSTPKSLRRLRTLLQQRPPARVVIDATSPSLANRRLYYEALREGGVDGEGTLVIHLALPRALSLHLQRYRERTQERPRVPDIATRVYEKHFQRPEEAEWEGYPGRVRRQGWVPGALSPPERLYFSQRLLS